jgi:hypothetical protein
MVPVTLCRRVCRRAAGCMREVAGSGGAELGRCLVPFGATFRLRLHGWAWYMYLQRCHSHLQRTRTCNALAPATHSQLQRTRICSALAPATHSHLQRTRTCDALAPATLAPAIHSRTCNALAPKACPQLGNLPTPSQHCSGRFSAALRPFRKHPLQFCDGTRRLPNSRVPSAHRL